MDWVSLCDEHFKKLFRKGDGYFATEEQELMCQWNPCNQWATYELYQKLSELDRR